MPAKIVEIEGIGKAHLFKRHGSRSIRLSFTSKGEVRISLPHWTPYQTGITFARDRIDWILKHQPTPLNQMFENGGRIGKAHRLQLITDPKSKSVQVRLKDTTIAIKFPPEASAASIQTAVERGARRALLKEAEGLLPQKLRDLAIKHKFSYHSVNVKQLKSRWGSCNQNKDITLNYYLMQLPWPLIDYVLVHELVHTEYLNHSPEFWQRFESIMPNAKKIRKELKTYKTEIIPT